MVLHITQAPLLLQNALPLPLYRLPVGPSAVVLIPALLLDLPLSLAIPAFGLPFVAVLIAFPGSLVLAILPLYLPLPFGLVTTNSPNAVPARAVLAGLPFALPIVFTLSLRLLPVPPFGLTLLDLGLALLLCLTLLLLPGFVSLLHLFAALRSPDAAVLSLLLGPSGDGRGGRTPLFRLPGLTLFTALGPLLLALLATFGSLLFLLGALLLLLFTTLVAPLLSIGIRA